MFLVPFISYLLLTPGDTDVNIEFPYVSGMSSYILSAISNKKENISKQYSAENDNSIHYINVFFLNLTQNTEYNITLQVFVTDLHGKMLSTRKTASIKTKGMGILCVFAHTCCHKREFLSEFWHPHD